MEMSNNLIPELHVAQQRRRDKLRVQHFDELQTGNNNFHHHLLPPPGSSNNNSGNNNNTSQLLLPPEMLNFTASHSSNPFPNIHPTRFVAPSSSDSCDPQQPQPLQSCENWVPTYNNQTHARHLPSVLPQIEYQNSWGNELPLLPANFVSQGMGMGTGMDTNSHRLSLSLSSNQICEYQHLGDPDPDHGHRELKPFESGNISSVVMKQCSSSSSGGGKLECGNNNNNQVPDIAGTSIIHNVHRNVGPLGPFTGYAAILKSSKFLKPAQLLLDEFFSAAGLWKSAEESENGPSVPTSRSHIMGDCYTGMGSKIHGSSDSCGRSPSCTESYHPDCHERKAKLLHMQEEVCKRHKQYHQQMQMVLSAFDSVPGLSNATPYISRSLKTISRHFRCLKNAIADQLKHLKRALGEDLSSPTSFLKGDSSSSSLRFDQNFAKVKSGSVGGMAHVGHQNHVWRPQRGLPERAVSILRAWLFDHFLHPYPTDNDKQMLATQTGLTRNQVSNWFINARVRLWKPMVEEIHMLETKGGSRPDPNSNDTVMSVIAKNRQQAAAPPSNQSGCKPPVNLGGACDNSRQLECLGPSTSLDRPRGEVGNTEQLFQKCSRIETHQVPANMDGSFITFLPYQRRGLEIGGIGAVSLTLGLRHGSAETSQQQLQHQFLPQGMPFGGHVIHDFPG